MPRFCANLGFLFDEVPFLDRFDAAARAGFTGVEYASPYEYSATVLRARLNAAGLSQILINSPAGNRAAGERGMACLPGRVPAFRDGVAQALDYATALDCKLVHVMAGVPPQDVAWDTAAALYAANLAWAAEKGVSRWRRTRHRAAQPARRARLSVAHPGAGCCNSRGNRA